MTEQEIITDEVAPEALKALVTTGSRQMQEMADRINRQTLAEQAQAKQYVALLTRQGPRWLQGAKPDAVVAFTRAAVGLALNPLLGECYLIHGGFYASVAGRLKLAERTGKRGGESAPRMMTPAEEELHGVHEGDVARIVEVWHKGRDMPAVGVGIIRKGEIEVAQNAGMTNGKYNLPTADNPPFMAAKRAMVAGLRVAFPDLDIAVADMADRGEGRYTVSTVEDGEVLEEGEASENEPDGFTIQAPMSAEPTTAASVGPPETQPVEPAAQTPETVMGTVAAIVWGAEAEANIPAPAAIAQVLGVTPEDWLAASYTVEDAADVAFTVRGYMQTPPGMNVVDAASKAHGLRAASGLPYSPDAIKDEDIPQPAAEGPPPAEGEGQLPMQQEGNDGS